MALKSRTRFLTTFDHFSTTFWTCSYRQKCAETILKGIFWNLSQSFATWFLSILIHFSLLFDGFWTCSYWQKCAETILKGIFWISDAENHVWKSTYFAHFCPLFDVFQMTKLQKSTYPKVFLSCGGLKMSCKNTSKIHFLVLFRIITK